MGNKSVSSLEPSEAFVPRKSRQENNKIVLFNGRYRIVEKFKKGNMGDTWLCEDLDQNDIKVVVKSIKLLDLVNDEQYRVLFEKEKARMLDMAECAEVPDLLDVFDEEYEGNLRHFFVQTFVDGSNLIDIVSNDGSFSRPEVVDFMKQIFQALVHIHSKRIIHRDIKLENIMRDKNGKYFIIDFGVARVLEEWEREAKTLIGSPLYMADEHKVGKATFKSDIYAVGLCVVALLFGAERYLDKDILYFIREKLPATDDLPLSSFLLRLSSPIEGERPTAEEALAYVENL